MAKNKDKDAAEKAGKKDKKDKKGRKGGEEGARGASIANHPRARAMIRRMKGWGGLGGFALAALLSLQASVPLVTTGLRAIGAGVLGYLLAWWIGVLVWRQLIIAEQKAAYELIQRRRQESEAPAP